MLRREGAGHRGLRVHRIPRRRSSAWRTATSRASSTSSRPHHREMADGRVRTGRHCRAVRSEGVVRGCDAVVHLAAVSDVNRVLSESCPRRGNQRGGGTRAVLEAARVERRLAGSSTPARSGCTATPTGMARSTRTSRIAPGHLYTATKLAGEMYCSSFGGLYGLDTTIARFGIPYGPRARPATVLAAFVAPRPRARANHDRRGRNASRAGSSTSRTSAKGVVATLDPARRAASTTWSARRTRRCREIAETVARVVAPSRSSTSRVATATSRGRRSPPNVRCASSGGRRRSPSARCAGSSPG